MRSVIRLQLHNDLYLQEKSMCSQNLELYVNVTFGSLSLRILQFGAAPISSDDPVLSVDQLADQVADVLDFFG